MGSFIRQKPKKSTDRIYDLLRYAQHKDLNKQGYDNRPLNK